MVGIIWRLGGQQSYEDAVSYLETVVLSEYKQMGIKIKNKTAEKYDYHVMFENGDLWRIVLLNDTARGYKANVSLIPYDTPPELVNGIVVNVTTRMPFQAFNYYN